MASNTLIFVRSWPERRNVKSSITHLSERGGLRRVASAARGDRGVPQPLRVRLPRQDDERLAAREENGQRLQVGGGAPVIAFVLHGDDLVLLQCGERLRRAQRLDLARAAVVLDE